MKNNLPPELDPEVIQDLTTLETKCLVLGRLNPLRLQWVEVRRRPNNCPLIAELLQLTKKS
jgi:hypothetical protein